MNLPAAWSKLENCAFGLGITTRDVESRSQRIAETEKKQEFQIPSLAYSIGKL